MSDIEENKENKRIIELVLNSKYSGSTPKQNDLSWKPGELCICRYKFDNNWHRGEVLRIAEGGSHCVVRYVDYGTVGNCEFTDMRKQLYAKEFPVQCFQVQLDIDPIGSRWEEAQLNLIHESFVDQQMRVVVLNRNNAVPLVKLSKISGSLGDIGKFLCSNGFAKRRC